MLNRRITREAIQELNATKVIEWSKDKLPTFYNGYLGMHNFINYLIDELTISSDTTQDDFCSVFGLE